MSDESSLAEYQACAGPKIGDVAPWLASLCDCVVWLFPHPALTQGLFLNEVIVKKKTFITI